MKFWGNRYPHQQRDADGHVGVSTEVGIDLQGVSVERHEHLETAVGLGCSEDAVVEVDGDPVGQQDLFEQAVENPESGQAHRGTGDGGRLEDLGHEIRSAHDGTGHQLGKEGHVEPEVRQPAERRHMAPVDVHGVADGLEGVEADADGEQDAVDGPGRPERSIGPHCEPVSRNDVGARRAVPRVGEEVGVLEIEQQAEVERDAQGEPPGPPSRLFGPGDAVSDEVVADRGGEEQDEHEPTRRLPVEQKAGEQKPGMTKGAMPVAVPCGIHRQHSEEEEPEPAVQEGPRGTGVVGEEAERVHHRVSWLVSWLEKAARTRVS